MTARIVFLCTGNICRSPVSEVLARQRFEGLDLEFASAGLDAVPGLPASQGSVELVAERGLDLCAHASQPLTADLLRGTVWLVGMTRSHAAICRARLKGAFSGRIGVLGAPGVDLSEGIQSPPVEEVGDPYGGPIEAYRTMVAQVDRLLDGWGSVFAALADGKDRSS